MNKPVIIFTNFWDAEKLIKDGYTSFDSDGKPCKLNFIVEDDKPVNFEVSSIALMKPDMSKFTALSKYFPDMPTIGHFCPTYDILMRHKGGGSWEDYVVGFNNLMKSRRHEVKTWLADLKPNMVYILCCWENTSGKAKCHRQLIYNAFCKHRETTEKNVLIYRHGGRGECTRSNARIENFDNNFLNKNDLRIDVEEHDIVKGIKGGGLVKSCHPQYSQQGESTASIAGMAAIASTISTFIMAPEQVGNAFSIGFDLTSNAADGRLSSNNRDDLLDWLTDLDE